jgi:predicted metal-dependent hydrolase
MYGIHVGFLAGMVLQVGLSLVLDRDARRHPLKTLRSLYGLRTHVFFQRKVQQRLRDYHRRDFHPDDHDTVELLDHWRTELGALQAA